MARKKRLFARLGVANDLKTQAQFDSYIGPYGEITGHPGGLRWHDGFTPGGIPLDGSLPMTQARLDYISPTQVRLVPASGSYLWINGRNVALPSVVNLSNVGLSELTPYYTYAYVSGSSVALEASTTGHAAHASGVRVKSGDPSRTLVGMLYTDAGGVFAYVGNKRYVRSFYNRPQVTFNGTYGSGSTTSTTAVDLNPATLSASCVVFADDMIDFSFVGNVSNSNGSACATLLGIDGGTVGSQQTSSGQTGNYPASPRATALRAEGLHTMSVRGFVTSGTTGNWGGSIIGRIG